MTESGSQGGGAGLGQARWVMKGKSRNRVRAEKGLFDRRKAEKQRSRDEDRRALESGQKSRVQLQQENALFAGMNVRIDLDRAKALS
jgi:hypothetical protein